MARMAEDEEPKRFILRVDRLVRVLSRVRIDTPADAAKEYFVSGLTKKYSMVETRMLDTEETLTRPKLYRVLAQCALPSLERGRQRWRQMPVLLPERVPCLLRDDFDMLDVHAPKPNPTSVSQYLLNDANSWP